MGWRFRKSVKLGPFRMTFSKSGVSTSVGVKGARITKRADGKIQQTVSIPGAGVYNTKTVSSGKPAAPAPAVSRPSYTAASQPRSNPYEHVQFYLEDTRLKNPDGTKRQDALYWYKMRKPPFDGQVDAAVLSDPETPELVEVTLNGHVIGKAPEDKARFICENWDRLDCVSAIEVQGPRGQYEAYVYVRFHKPKPKIIPEPEPEPEPPREEQMRDYYDMGTKKQGCGCAVALAIGIALLLVACNALF